MPELPEVQTVTNDLQILTGDIITGFWTNWPRAISTISPATLEKKIKGKKIKSICRLSKFIVLNLNSEESLLIHLRMTGKLLVKSEKLKVKNKHLHHVFYLKKHGALEFHDIRKFATIKIVPTSEVKLENFKLGMDPLDKKFTPAYLKEIMAKRPNKSIKSLLLDQEMLSGIGNIYASEILFNAGILPDRKAVSLSSPEISTLCKSIKKILIKAIQMRGTSVSDYRDGNGKKGSFQKVLKVYKKHGQKCHYCATMIEKSVIGQRSTFYCPTCQH
jgi:formamidopyrimidine-DNA glycosylase